MHNKFKFGPVEGSFQATFRSIIISNATQITNEMCSNIFSVEDFTPSIGLLVVVIKGRDYILDEEEHAHMIVDAIKHVQAGYNSTVELRITTRTNELKIRSLEVIKYK